MYFKRIKEVAVLVVPAKLVFKTCLDQSEAVASSQAEPIIPLFSAVITVMVQWLHIQALAIYIVFITRLV